MCVLNMENCAVPIDAYIGILMDARRAILNEYGSNDIAIAIACDLTAIINAVATMDAVKGEKEC